MKPIPDPDPFGVVPPSIHYAQELERVLDADGWQHRHSEGISTVIFEDEQLIADDIDLPPRYSLYEIEYDEERDWTIVRTRHP